MLAVERSSTTVKPESAGKFFYRSEFAYLFGIHFEVKSTCYKVGKSRSAILLSRKGPHSFVGRVLSCGSLYSSKRSMCQPLNHRQPLPAAACMIPGGYRAVVIQYITRLPCLGSAYLKHCYLVPCPLPFPAFTASQVAYIPKKVLTEKEFQSKKTRGSEVHHGSKGREVEVFHLSK